MFKFFAAIVFAVIACCLAKPGYFAAPLAYSAPVVAAPAPFVTATSSQVIARNYNGIVSAPVVAPFAAPVVAARSIGAPLAYSAYAAPAPFWY